MIDSTLYTIGTALGRARESGVEVQVLVSGHWLGGRVRGIDGHGVILASGPEEHAVVRTEDISAVRVMREVPVPPPTPRLEAHARPMPAGTPGS
jgi:sRNA-binding regulator protein Hfq